MKKGLKMAIIILIVLSILVYVIFKVLHGSDVSIKDKIEIKKFAETYLTNKYGEHKFKVTGIRYEYNMTTPFDNSNSTGYRVSFKSDVVSNSWVIITGMSSDVYKIGGDYFIGSYYFPEKDESEVYKILEKMEPINDFESFLLDELRNEFDNDLYEGNCDSIVLDIPSNYGKIPSLEELKTNISLYKVTHFNYKVSTAIEDTKMYEERLKSYINNKYNANSDIYFYLDNTLVSVYLNY